MPGTAALMSVGLQIAPDGARSLGIYNCRSVRGRPGVPSTHGEGRAADLGIPAEVGGTIEGWELCERLLSNAGPLGIQYLVYSRWAWSASAPSGRKYRGSAPHWDHLHIEQTREAAGRLTTATARALLVDKPARRYAQAVVAWSDTDVEQSRVIAKGYGIAMTRVNDAGKLMSVSHPGETAIITDFAVVFGGGAVARWRGRPSAGRVELAGKDRNESAKLVFDFVRTHDPATWKRRGLPW